MSKQLTYEELSKLKKRSLESMEGLLNELIKSETVNLQKKASLLSYWISSYSGYIRQEEAFDPTKMKSYKRGDIIKLDFGFNPLDITKDKCTNT